MEIKKSASPDKREIKKYSVIEKTSLQQGNGGIICILLATIILFYNEARAVDAQKVINIAKIRDG